MWRGFQKRSCIPTTSASGGCSTRTGFGRGGGAATTGTGATAGGDGGREDEKIGRSRVGWRRRVDAPRQRRIEIGGVGGLSLAVGRIEMTLGVTLQFVRQAFP